jgi:hypothetical protein
MRNPLITLVLGLIFPLYPLSVLAQQSPTHRADSLTNLLVDRHKKVNAAKMSMPGYRIQIYFGSERSKANEIKSDFTGGFPQTSAYLVYHQPNFKVRVGDFRTRLEAMGFLKKLGDRYTTAFIVQDEVKLPEL